MDIWELLGTAVGSICIFIVLHMAIFLLVRWMYPPTVIPMPMSLPEPKVVPPAPAPVQTPEVPLPEYYTQPVKKDNAKADEITLPVAPSREEGATNIGDL